MPRASSRASNCWGEVGSVSAAGAAADWADWVMGRGGTFHRQFEALRYRRTPPNASPIAGAEPRFCAQALEMARNQRLANASLIGMMRAAHRRSAGVAQG